MAILELKSISKSYGKKTVLNNISCAFDSGVYGLLGPNGAGKTTLISIIVNILKSDSGQVLFNGKEIQRLGSKYFEDVAICRNIRVFTRIIPHRNFLSI
mgnify:CR=1 FL=1